MLTQDELKEHLSYDAETGIFIRKSVFSKSHAKVGDVAGVIASHGYCQIGVKGKIYRAHRLAWLYMTGELPKNYIDHINGVKHDNRFKNLRDVSCKTNMENIFKRYKNNKSGFQGVVKLKNRYMATITHYGKTIYLGLYKSAEEAHKVYLENKKSLHKGCTL